MMTTNILVLIGGAGVFQSLFLSVYVLTTALRNKMYNILLLLLNLSLLTFLVNTIYLFISKDHGNILASSFSLGALALIGPLSFLYVKAFVNPTYKISYKDLLHLLPAFVPLFLNAGFNKAHIGYIGGYIFLYQALSIWWTRDKALIRKRKLWVYSLAGGLIAILTLIIFFSFGKLCIISISIGFTVIAYLISYLGIRFYQDLFFNPSTSSISAPSKVLVDNAGDSFNCADRSIIQKELYKDAGLTLPRLASMLGIHTHKLSFLINSQTGKSFPEYINQLRIEESKRLLLQSDLKVAAVAYECGFNSLSTFYAIFKKETGVSPSEFRKGKTN